VICASNESQQPIHAAPIANQRLQNQQPGSSWGLVGVGDQALAIEGRCRRGFQVFFTAMLAADRNINYSRETGPGLDGKEPRSAREYSAAVPFIQGERCRYCAAKKYFELVGLPH
jgi:hypothetical protein